MRRTRDAGGAASLRELWSRNAADWLTWARAPGHDSYWRFHRDAFLELLPPPGRLTVDLGCGEGRLSRDLTALGHRVVAVDASEAMVAAAREADPSIEAHVADAAALPLADGAADLVVAFMSLQDVDDLDGAVGEAARVLAAGGTLCLALVHPLNSAGEFDGEDEDAPFVVRGSYLGESRYVDEVERDGLRVAFASAHRPLERYTEALAGAGFVVERLREPPVPEEAGDLARRRWRRLPLFLHLRARRRPVALP